MSREKFYEAVERVKQYYIPADCDGPGILWASRRIEKLEKALLFYGNEDNWVNDVVDIGVGNQPVPGTCEASMDDGRVARLALRDAGKE